MGLRENSVAHKESFLKEVAFQARGLAGWIGSSGQGGASPERTGKSYSGEDSILRKAKSSWGV